MRNYETGATRDNVEGKLRYEGFIAPRVLRRFAEYMHKHRYQADGQVRDADNWQKGIPVDDYMDSLVRHVMDLWYIWRERGVIDEELACAIFFNDQGLLFEATAPAKAPVALLAAPCVP